ATRSAPANAAVRLFSRSIYLLLSARRAERDPDVMGQVHRRQINTDMQVRDPHAFAVEDADPSGVNVRVSRVGGSEDCVCLPDLRQLRYWPDQPIEDAERVPLAQERPDPRGRIDLGQDSDR